MSLAIRPVFIQPAQLPKIQKKPVNQIYQNNINFGSLEGAKALEAMNTSHVTKNLIASDKTRLGANYNKESGNVDFKLASKNAQDVFLCIFDKPKGEDAFLNIKMEKRKSIPICRKPLTT